MIDCSGGCVVVMREHIRLAICEDGDQVVQGHETEVGIIVVQLGEKLGDGGGGRIGRNSLRHLEITITTRRVIPECGRDAESPGQKTVIAG